MQTNGQVLYKWTDMQTNGHALEKRTDMQTNGQALDKWLGFRQMDRHYSNGHTCRQINSIKQMSKHVDRQTV